MKASKSFRDLSPNYSPEADQTDSLLGNKGGPQDSPIPPGSTPIPLVEEYSPHKLRGQVATQYPDGTIVHCDVNHFPTPKELVEDINRRQQRGKRRSALIMNPANEVRVGLDGVQG